MTGAWVGFLAIPEALVLALIATAAGRKICARLLPDASPLETSVVGFPVGMGILSLLMTGLLFGRVPAVALPFVLGAVLVAAAAWAREEAVDVVGDLRDFVRESPALSTLIGASAVLGAVGCLAPETGFDTGVYHFAMARLRAEQGGMLVRFDVPHGFRPASLESLHTAGFLLNGEALASLINESFYFAGLALARLWGLRLGGPRAGTFAALAWMSPVTYVLRMNGGDVEVAQAVYLGATLLALLKLRDGGAPGWRVIAGGSLGLLVGLKYASLNAAVLVAVLWAIVRLKDRTAIRTLAADAAVVGVLGLLIASPWYLRNQRVAGSPFYPFQATTAVGDGGQNPVDEGSMLAVGQALALDGFVLAGLAGLALPSVRRERWTGLLWVLLLLWTLRQTGWGGAPVTNALRYSSPGWLPLLAFGGAGVAWAFRRGRGWRVVSIIGLIGAVALGQGVLAARNLPKLPAAVGLQSRQAYLESRVTTARAIHDAEAALPAGKRILLVEERVYYCRSPFLGASDIQDVVRFDRMTSAADVRRFLEAESIGAIVVDRTPTAKTYRFRDLERRLGPAWPPPGVRAVPVEGQASLYKVE